MAGQMQEDDQMVVASDEDDINYMMRKLKEWTWRKMEEK